MRQLCSCPSFPTRKQLWQRPCRTWSHQYLSNAYTVPDTMLDVHVDQADYSSPHALWAFFFLTWQVPTSQNSENLNKRHVCKEISTALGTEQMHHKYHLSSSPYRSGNWGTETLSRRGSVNDRVGLRFQAVGFWGQQAFKHPTQCLAHDRLSLINGGQIVSRI